ncbi:MAG: WecB/TagA/CpsF family glycosyltransferase [Actinomycetales bacterium]
MPAQRDQRLAGVIRRRVGSLDYSVMTLDQASALVTELGLVRPPVGVAVHFAPAYTNALADADQDYRELINQADLVFSDGMPVVWAGRRLHPDAAGDWTRVYGPDVMCAVLDASTDQGPAHYLLGGSDATRHALADRIQRDWPAARIVGSESPPFREATGAELAERDARITASGATLVWVGLGTPKQDLEDRRLASSLAVTALGVGAAFDFLAGTVSQAPRWMQRSGLEWGYRLAKEPRRLACRYLWGNPRFLISVGRQAARRRTP